MVPSPTAETVGPPAPSRRRGMRSAMDVVVSFLPRIEPSSVFRRRRARPATETNVGPGRQQDIERWSVLLAGSYRLASSGMARGGAGAIMRQGCDRGKMTEVAGGTHPRAV